MRLKRNDRYIVLDPPVKLERNEYSSADYREKVIAACRLYKFMTLRRRDGEGYPKPFLNRNLIYQNNTNKITFNMALGIHDPPLVFKVNSRRVRDRRDDNEKRKKLDNQINKLNLNRVKNEKVENGKRVVRDFCDLDAYYSGVERAFKHLNMAPQKEIIVKDGYIVGQNAEIRKDQFSDYVLISDFSFQRNPKRCYCHFKFYLNYIFHDGRQVTEEIKNGEFRGIFPIKTPYQIDLPSPKKMRISTKEAKLLIKVRTALIQELSEPLSELPSPQEMEMPGFFRGEYFASRTIWTNSSPLQYDYSDFAMNVVHVKNLRPGFIYEERQYDIYSRDLMFFENPAIIGKIARFRTDALSLLVPTEPLHRNIRVRKCTKNCGKTCRCGFANGIISGKCTIGFNSDFITDEERIRKYEYARNPDGDDSLTYISNLLNISKVIENESSDEDDYSAYQTETPCKSKTIQKSFSTRSKTMRPTSRSSLNNSSTSKSTGITKSRKGFRTPQSSKSSKQIKVKKGSGVKKGSKVKKEWKSTPPSKAPNSSKSIKSKSSDVPNKRGASITSIDSPISKRLRTETTPLSSLRRSSRFHESATHSPEDDDARSTSRSRSRQSLKRETNTEMEYKVEEEENDDDEDENEEELEDEQDQQETERHKRRLYFDLFDYLGKYPAENGKYVNHFRFLQNFYCKSFLLSKEIQSRMRNIFINIPEIFLFYRFLGASSSEPPGTKIYKPVIKYDFRSCHVENLYNDPNPATFMKLRPMVPQKCIICDRSFETTFSLLMHCNLNYPRLRFSYAVAKTEILSKSMVTQIDVSLNPYYKEGAENRSISIGRDATQTTPFFAVTPWHTRTIRNNMRMDLTMFVEGLSFTDIKVRLT